MKKISFKSTVKKMLATLLIALMLVPTLASCSDDSEIQDTVIPVYTFYGIKGEGTTDESIRAVELAINRILISRYTLAVDLRLFAEDEYEEALNAAIKEAESYEETDDSSIAEEDEELYTYTEDKIIDMLENGKDFVLKAPRVDIVLCKDSAQYTNLASNGKLVALDTTLENEAKVLTEYIHPTIMSLAKIGRKTYGVPNNVALGEYEYIVFNKKYLDENRYDYKTMKTLGDLEDYLKLIKTNHPNVLPLKDAGSPAQYEYLFGNNSPFYLEPFTTDAGDNTAKIHGTFDTELFTHIIDDYATLLAKYRSFGYMAEDPSKFDDFAVTFIKGTQLEIEALEAETGKDFEYSIYKNPVATKDSLSALYGISSTVSNTEVTTVVDIIVSIFTDEQIKNTLYYGIQGENYIVDDFGFIEPIKNGKTDKFEYVMKNEYTGNIYLAQIKQGENKEIYNFMKDLNIATSLSLTSGFAYVPATYKIGDKTITEPNYVEIMAKALGDAHKNLANGSYAIIDYDQYAIDLVEEIQKTALEEVLAAFVKELEDTHMAEFEIYTKSKEYLSTLDARAEEAVNVSLVATSKRTLETEVKAAVLAENPNATEEEIQAACAEQITDAVISKYISDNYTKSDIQTLVKNRKNTIITNDSKDELKKYKASTEYLNAISKYSASEQYTADVEAYIGAQGDNLVDTRYIIALNDALIAKATEIQKEAVDAVNNAIEKFNKEACELFGWSEEDMYDELDVFTYTDFVENRIEEQYYNVYTNPLTATN